jgi:hypothetical protein
MMKNDKPKQQQKATVGERYKRQQNQPKQHQSIAPHRGGSERATGSAALAASDTALSKGTKTSALSNDSAATVWPTTKADSQAKCETGAPRRDNETEERSVLPSSQLRQWRESSASPGDIGLPSEASDDLRLGEHNLRQASTVPSSRVLSLDDGLCNNWDARQSISIDAEHLRAGMLKSLSGLQLLPHGPSDRSVVRVESTLGGRHPTFGSLHRDGPVSAIESSGSSPKPWGDYTSDSASDREVRLRSRLPTASSPDSNMHPAKTGGVQKPRSIKRKLPSNPDQQSPDDISSSSGRKIPAAALRAGRRKGLPGGVDGTRHPHARATSTSSTVHKSSKLRHKHGNRRIGGSVSGLSALASSLARERSEVAGMLDATRELLSEGRQDRLLSCDGSMYCTCPSCSGVPSGPLAHSQLSDHLTVDGSVELESSFSRSSQTGGVALHCTGSTASPATDSLARPICEGSDSQGPAESGGFHGGGGGHGGRGGSSGGEGGKAPKYYATKQALETGGVIKFRERAAVGSFLFPVLLFLMPMIMYFAYYLFAGYHYQEIAEAMAHCNGYSFDWNKDVAYSSQFFDVARDWLADVTGAERRCTLYNFVLSRVGKNIGLRFEEELIDMIGFTRRRVTPMSDLVAFPFILSLEWMAFIVLFDFVMSMIFHDSWHGLFFFHGWHSYRFVCWDVEPQLGYDGRPDNLSTTDLKHEGLHCWMEYRGPHNIYGKLWRPKKLLISVEALAQMTSMRVLNPAVDEATAVTRMEHCLSSLQSVNTDRYAFFKRHNQSPMQNSYVVAYAMYRQMKDLTEKFPNVRTHARDRGDGLGTVIESVRLNCRSSSKSKYQRTLPSLEKSVWILGLLCLSALVAMWMVYYFHMETPMTRSQVLREWLSDLPFGRLTLRGLSYAGFAAS